MPHNNHTVYIVQPTSVIKLHGGNTEDQKYVIKNKEASTSTSPLAVQANAKSSIESTKSMKSRIRRSLRASKDGFVDKISTDKKKNIRDSIVTLPLNLSPVQNKNVIDTNIDTFGE